jgi:glycine/D-amino acid oxidase-like deaminating enzyme
MSPRYGVSPWTSQFPAARRPAFPRYKGDSQAEVVIIGAGLTGCATAYACAAAGFKPVVIEAERVGFGATAYGTGLILPEPGPAFRDFVHSHGLRVGKRAFVAWRRAALDAASLLRRLNVRCGLEPLDSLVTGPADAEKALRREYDARVDAGLDLAWLTGRQARAVTRTEGDACGFRQAGAFAFDPYRACIGLASAARSRGAVFYEGSLVKKVRPGRAGVEIVCDKGTVRASTVIVATGAPSSLFAPLRRHFTPRDTYHVLTDVMSPAVRRQVGVASATIRDSHVPPHRIRWTADHRALIAGAERAEAPVRSRDGLVREWTFELMYELLKVYPAISGLQPAFGWRLSSATTKDGLPYIGPHRNFPRHLFALGGAAGESAAGAFLASRILLRALVGTPQKGDEDFGWTR